MNIRNLTPQQLRRAAEIKDEIDELTKTLMELAAESRRVSTQAKAPSPKIGASDSLQPLTAVPIAPAPANAALELPKPIPEHVPDQAPQISEEQPPVATTHVTNSQNSTSNSQLADEQHQTPVVYVTEGQQETTTVTATNTETGSNVANQVPSVPAAAQVKWDIQRLLQEVARVIAEHPEKIPALRAVGIPALTNEYIREATEVVAKLNFTTDKLNSSLWELGKNVTQDVAVLPAINELGMRNLGDLLGKLNGLGDYASRRGQILILARLWSLAGVAAESADTDARLV